jgi:parallel beta-helix repeat protein
MRRIAPFVAAVLALTVPGTAGARTIHVGAGESIQAAVDRAHHGDTIVVAPGTYREQGRRCPTEPSHRCAVVVKKSHLRLVARPSRRRAVVLRARRGQEAGIAVGKSRDPSCLTMRSMRVHGSLVKGFTIRGFAGDGVLLFCVDHYRVTRVRAVDNAEYGIFPSHSVSGRVDHSRASGANDTGIYIGQSRIGRMDHNRSADNVSGYEIENSSHVRADHNVATGNTGGILSFALPGLDVKANTTNQIDHNRVRANDRRNTCLEPEDEVCKVPPGTGILVLSADRNRVEANRVERNRSVGIAVASYCVVLGLTPAQCAALDIDSNPDFNRIAFNRALHNGLNPDPSVPAPFTVDLAWDGTGTGNCWSGNVAGTIFPPSLPAC